MKLTPLGLPTWTSTSFLEPSGLLPCSQEPALALSQFNPEPFNPTLLLGSMSRSSKWSLSLTFSNSFYSFLSSTIPATSTARRILLDLTILKTQYCRLSSTARQFSSFEPKFHNFSLPDETQKQYKEVIHTVSKHGTFTSFSTGSDHSDFFKSFLSFSFLFFVLCSYLPSPFVMILVSLFLKNGP
jgi:hypothetical protein